MNSNSKGIALVTPEMVDSIVGVMEDCLNQGLPQCVRDAVPGRMRTILKALEQISKMAKRPRMPLVCLERPPLEALQEVVKACGKPAQNALVLDQLLSWPAIPVFDDVPFGSISDLIAWFEKLTGASRPRLVGRASDWWVRCLELPVQNRKSSVCPDVIGLYHRGDDYKVRLSSIDCLYGDPDITLRATDQPKKRELKHEQKGDNH